MKTIDLKNRPSEAKRIFEKIGKKLKESKEENTTKDGVDLEKFAKDLAKKKFEQTKNE